MTNESNKITWKLFLKKEGKETVELDNEIIENNPVFGNDFTLYEPDLIDGFIDNNCLYAFVYKGRRLFLCEFEFIGQTTKFNKSSQAVTPVSLGSVDNFGGFNFAIQKYVIDKKKYFHLNYGRDVGGKSNVILVFINGKIKKLIFSESTQNIKDEKEIFKTLDLDKNSDKVSAEIKKALIENKYLKKEADFKYLGNIDITPFKERGSRNLGGVIYFFYEVNNLSTNIVRYDCDDNEWLLGDYKEEDIKQ